AEYAAVERDRARRLESQCVVSEQALQAAEADATARARALAAAESAVTAAGHEVEAARAALLRPGTGAPGDRPAQALTLRAPVDGVVLRRLRESEAVVPQGEPLLEIGDTASLEVIADFLSADAVKIEAGQRVLIDQWGGPVPLDGRVRRVEPSAFLKVSALGVEEQRVWVVIDFDDPRSAGRALGDGYRVEARVVVWERPGVLQAPASSLFRRGDGWAVFAVRGGRATAREVRVGQRTGLAAEILSGLQASDLVIVHPPDTVTDGTRVAGREPAGGQ
ncbi:MAG TPA: HlyD family efflux transporter periplasmic adaptor subunit, partial [Vicinamibacterales bacterium]|nr:HlyD family efflux transporter periplasmic adaptor subunit [Vicinamibacterales bacterium]